MTVTAWVVHSLAPGGLYAAMGAMPLWARFGAAMVVGELGSYWGHRWMHQVPVLWRFHAIHHSAEEIDWLVNTRAHPVNLAFTRMCAFVPMYLLGLAQPLGNSLDLVPVLVTVAGTVWGFFIHSNVSWRFGQAGVGALFPGLPRSTRTSRPRCPGSTNASARSIFPSKRGRPSTVRTDQ